MNALHPVKTLFFYLFLFLSPLNAITAQPQTKKGPSNPGKIFYKHFSGTLGEKRITLEFHAVNHDSFGSYYYLDQGESIALKTPFTKGEKSGFILEELKPGAYESDYPNRWYFKLDGSSLKGIWQNPTGTVKYPIYLEETYPQGVTPFDYFSFYENIASPRPTKHAFSHEVHYTFPLPKDHTTLAWLSREIKTNLAFDPALTFQAGFNQKVKRLKADFETSFEDYEDELDHYSLPDWKTTVSMTVTYNNKGYLVLEKKESHYQGGAHGYIESSLYCYDMAQKAPMALNAITSISPRHLEKLVEEQFRKDYNLLENEGLDKVLFKDKIPLTSNFGLNEKGIYFNYKPYEIAPYSMGSIRILIPYARFSDTLNPAFKDRMQLKPKI